MAQTKGISSSNRMAIYSELSNRLALAGYFGKQYGDKRDLYTALGYPEDVTCRDYAAKFKRLDIANAIINRPVNATWRGELSLVETDKGNETAFEKAWKELDKRLKLKNKFIRVDRLTGLGRYGILLLGFDDVPDAQAMMTAVKSGTRKLLYVKALGELDATVNTYVTDSSNERYGLPLTYNITLSTPDGSSTNSLVVHHSRIIHIVDQATENECLGTPRLEAVYNRLMDLEKVVGGSAEMYWRGARPGYAGKVDPDYNIGTVQRADLEEQMDLFEHDLRRLFINEGIELKALEQQLADPKATVDVQLMMISAVTGIPKRILTGTEEGKLAGSQDADEWASYITGRRDEFAEPMIVREFVDVMIKYGVLPKSEEYTVAWQDLFSLSENDKVKIGAMRATAIKDYCTNPMAQEIMPPKAFFEFLLGLDADQVDIINTMMEEYMNSEEKLKADQEKELEEIQSEEIEIEGEQDSTKKPASPNPPKQVTRRRTV
jgi:hypothetical protein